jgi:hypothetical protein
MQQGILPRAEKEHVKRLKDIKILLFYRGKLKRKRTWLSLRMIT